MEVREKRERIGVQNFVLNQLRRSTISGPCTQGEHLVTQEITRFIGGSIISRNHSSIDN